MVCASAGGDPNDTNHTSFKTMTFKNLSKIKSIYEKFRIDQSDLKPEMLWDAKNPPKPIWEDFNFVRPRENMDEKGRINGTNDHDYIPGTSGNDTINGLHGSDLIYGGNGDDHLRGDNNVFRSTDGVDTIYGGDGRDVIRAHFGYGEDGNDRLSAPHSGGAYLDGGDNDDRLEGGLDQDTLIGGTGKDYLRGGSESDTMSGGSGVDHFVVGQRNEHRRGIATDLITDFQDVGDKIQFELVSFRNLSFEDLEFAFNRAGDLVVSTDVTLVDDEERLNVSGVLAEIQGLNPRADLEQQIQHTGNGVVELIAEM